MKTNLVINWEQTIVQHTLARFILFNCGVPDVFRTLFFYLTAVSDVHRPILFYLIVLGVVLHTIYFI